MGENDAASNSASNFDKNNEPPADAKFSRMDLIKHEYEIWKHADSRMPLELLSRHLEDLVCMATPIERLLYLTGVGDAERHRQSKAAVKSLQRQAYNMVRDAPEHSLSDPLRYGMGGNFLFQRICKQIYTGWAMSHYAAHAPTTKFTVAFDFSLLEQCHVRDQRAAMLLVARALRCNISHRQPSQVLFTSFDRQSRWFSKWEGSATFPAESDSIASATIHEEHVTELFPLNRIVYLSPDAVSVLNDVDEDKIYVIGAFDDHCQVLHNATFAEAKKRAMPCYRLPIEKYVNWRSGTKVLDFCSVHQILLDYMLTHDWRTSLLKNIRPWKVYDGHEHSKVTHAERAPTGSLENRLKRSEIELFDSQRREFLLKLARVEPNTYK